MTFKTNYTTARYTEPGRYIGYDGGYNFETLDEAVNAARSKAWEEGRTQAVYTMISVVEAPEVVNTAKVTPLT